MTTVATHFGHSSPHLSPEHPRLAFNCCMGIELEIEEISHISVDLWDCKEDGSLRNGCELVCAEPYSGTELYEAIENLADSVGSTNAQGTWRCSTHVHMDMRDADHNILKKTILGWAFYEKMMFKCSGFHRYRSNFCPAFAVVQAQVMNTSQAFQRSGGPFFNSLIQHWDKYTSLNLLPLREFGSIEFRISEPKWKRSNVLNLVNRFLMLKKLAVENAAMSNQDFVEFLKVQAFDPMIPYLPLDYNPDVEDLELGYQIANDILAVRSRGINVIPRIRETVNGADGSPIIPFSELGHWEPYTNYLESTNRTVWANVVDMFPWVSGELATEIQLGELIDYLRELDVGDSNVSRLIPNGFRSDIRRYFERT